MLAWLEQNHLFIIPLDEQREWYRFHPFFKELLLHHLVLDTPDDVAALHEKAVQWYQSAGESGEAVRHAQAAGRTDQATRIIDEKFDDIMHEWGPGYLHRTLEGLPLEILKDHPRLAAHKGYHRLIHQGQEEAWESCCGRRDSWKKPNSSWSRDCP